MKFSRTEQQLRDVVVESYQICDKCGKKIEKSLFDAFSFEFELKTGDNFPETGNGETKEMDLCHPCAEELIKLLRVNGYTVNESEWDY